MKKPSEIWDTPEATGFDRVNTKDIEEWKETHDYKQAVFAANRYLDEPYLDPDGDECTISRQFLRMIERYDSLTQHHEAEVERALEDVGNYVDELYQNGNMDKMQAEMICEYIDGKLPAPTKTDNQ